MSEVKAIRLTSGEELLCQVSEGLNNTYLIENPRVLQVMPSPQGGYGLGLMPWFHSKSSGKITIAKEHIVAICEPDKEVETSYLSQISGIQIASAGSVLHS